MFLRIRFKFQQYTSQPGRSVTEKKLIFVQFTTVLKHLSLIHQTVNYSEVSHSLSYLTIDSSQNDF